MMMVVATERGILTRLAPENVIMIGKKTEKKGEEEGERKNEEKMNLKAKRTIRMIFSGKE